MKTNEWSHINRRKYLSIVLSAVVFLMYTCQSCYCAKRCPSEYSVGKQVDTVIASIHFITPRPKIEWHLRVIDGIIKETSSIWRCDGGRDSARVSISIVRSDEKHLSVTVDYLMECWESSMTPYYRSETYTYTLDGNVIGRMVLRDDPVVVALIREKVREAIDAGELDLNCALDDVVSNSGFIYEVDSIVVTDAIWDKMCYIRIVLPANKSYFRVEETSW
jgi:hypothetical protein